MISANINEAMLENYKKVHPRFEAAFEGLKKLVAENAEVGKYEIEGSDVYAMVQEYETKPISEKSFEIHKEYIDIQYIVNGEEAMGFESLDKLVPTTEYKPDVQLFALNDEYDEINLCAGEYVVFFPYEPHAPGAAVKGVPSKVRKIVVKIRA